MKTSKTSKTVQITFKPRLVKENTQKGSKNFTLKIVGFVMLLQPVDRSCLGIVFSFLLTTWPFYLIYLPYLEYWFQEAFLPSEQLRTLARLAQDFNFKDFEELSSLSDQQFSWSSSLPLGALEAAQDPEEFPVSVLCVDYFEDSQNHRDLFFQLHRYREKDCLFLSLAYSKRMPRTSGS